MEPNPSSTARPKSLLNHSLTAAVRTSVPNKHLCSCCSSSCMRWCNDLTTVTLASFSSSSPSLSSPHPPPASCCCCRRSQVRTTASTKSSGLPRVLITLTTAKIARRGGRGGDHRNVNKCSNYRQHTCHKYSCYHRTNCRFSGRELD